MDLLGKSIIGNLISSSAFADPEKEFIQSLSVGERKNEISLHIYHGNVIYVEEKGSVISHDQVAQYAPDIPKHIRPLFVKSKKYEEDHEYRYAFLHKRYGLLALRKEPVILRIDPVSRHLIDQTLAANHDE